MAKINEQNRIKCVNQRNRAIKYAKIPTEKENR